MFQKHFNLRRKSSDGGRQSRFQRTPTQSKGPSPSPSTVSESIPEDPLGRSTSPQTSGYLYPLSNTGHARKDSDTNPGDLGLNILYTPPHGHKVDIVFIHGLGGASRRTWSKNEDPDLFWPLKFLPLEPDVCLARIFTFGYNANFRTAGSLTTSVLDFAKDLLFDLKYANDEYKEELNIGTVPLVFVVHSMGGLIIKEAYIQGQNDPKYESIIRAISAITFLATPHRGTNLAELLDRILRTTIISNSKQYLSELAKNSFTLQKLNEQFRHIAPKLDIVSFYETHSTSIGLKKTRVMILEKDSSILGYPGETSRALDADHHNVCKFDGPKDPNYITVRNALRSLVNKIVSASRSNKPTLSTRRESYDLKSLLAITILPDTDYIFFRDQWAEGTNNWILEEENYKNWVQALDRRCSLLWLNGGAATGKSVLSSFIINSLVERGCSCQYFFIRFGDQKKRTLSFILRSIAYQLARNDSNFLERVLKLADETIDFETADSRTIWERIFKTILFTLESDSPLYWVIDGLDEADDSPTLVRLLSDISVSSIPIRILLVSRQSSDLEAVFQKAPQALDLRSISLEANLEDVRFYIRQELSMSGSTALKDSIIQRLISGSRNNFLWVRLAVEKLNTCHTQADVETALQQLPDGMEALYDRMAFSIAQRPSAADRVFATTVLQCVTCSLRVLTVPELSQALQEDVSKILNLQRSILDLCGGFVVIDNGGNVAMIHQTARQYLLSSSDRPFYFDKSAAHRQLFLSCMRCLMTVGLRAKVKWSQKPSDFLDYAATSWSSHLASTPLDDGQVVETLNKFLTGNWVLTWIHMLAAENRLRALVQASKHLSRYSARLKEQHAARNETDHPIVRQEVFDSWAVDFVQIVGKFSMVLRRDPESIYKLIPPFCPPNSAVYQQFGKTKDKSLVVTGLSNENWNDSLARISFGLGNYASSILAAGAQITILIPSGSALLYDSSTFEETASSPIRHGERLYRMEINSAGTLLATYGYRTTKIWEISTGICRLSVDNPQARPRPLAMLLVDNNTTLLVGTDDRCIRSLDLKLSHEGATWQLRAELEEPELEGHFLNAANHMALSKDGSLIAVAYRGHPLSAWETDGPVHIGHCWRKRDEIARGEVIEAVWHPHYPEILGLYIEGVVFKWRPYEDENDEIAAGASRLAISRDGNLFATGDVRGTVKVYTTSEFCMLYQLASEDTVLSMAFSPDLHRFYDIRGHYGNAWEPNVLRRYAEQRGQGAENGSEIESQTPSSTAAESWSARVDSITAIAASPAHRLYCYGTEQGTVRLHDMQRGKLADLHTSKSFIGIENMAWSSDGRLFAFSDSSKKLRILSIASDAGNSAPLTRKEAEMPLANSKNGPIIQLLFHPDSSRLLVRSTSTMQSISLTTFSATHSIEMDSAKSKWITHPLDPALLLGVATNTVHVLDWHLAEHRSYSFAFPQPQENMPFDPQKPREQTTVDRVLATSDKKHLFVQMSLRDQSSKEKLYFHFGTPSPPTSKEAILAADSPTGTTPITPFILNRNISSHIALCLCFVSNDNLVFLSKDFSVSSWKLLVRPRPSLPSSAPASRSSSVPTITSGLTNALGDEEKVGTSSAAENKVKPLFFLPGDWISRDCLALCSIWAKERSLLCPRQGEVAVVRCAALI